MGGGIRGKRPIFTDYRAGSTTQTRPDSQKNLNDFQSAPKPRVFISFHNKDKAQVNLLRSQAKRSDKLKFVDYSVREPFNNKWKTQCAKRIRRSKIVVVAIGENTHNRKAVDWEIRKAHELHKPVIGMRIFGDKRHKVPKAMVEQGDKIVPWKLKQVQSALDSAK